jgi:hypothetical protein
MHGDATERAKFEESAKEFKKLSDKVNAEIETGLKLAQTAIDTAATAKETKEFKHVSDLLKVVKVHHAGYDKHVYESFDLFKANNAAAATKLLATIKKEEKQLTHELRPRRRDYQIHLPCRPHGRERRKGRHPVTDHPLHCGCIWRSNPGLAADHA